jgi:hypothetical protein
MPVHAVEVASTYIKIWKNADDFQQFDFVGFVGPDDQTKADAIQDFIQENYLDVRQKLNTLPNDDPDRTIDPALPYLFWDGPGSPGQTDLVSRSVLITVTWTGSAYETLLERVG